MILQDARVYVAGHRGMVGSAIVRRLQHEGFNSLIMRTHDQVDLTVREAVFELFTEAMPEYVIISAARVGGIAANIAAPVDFLLDNLKIQNNLFEACLHFKVTKTVFLGSSCIYPREAPQPMREEYFMHGPLEPTNESYAVAKIAGIRFAQALRQQYGMSVICPMPSNVYGPGDHFDFERSHVVSALIRRFCEAADRRTPFITLWGTGSARRELLHVEDLAAACLFLVRNYDLPEIINVGTGEDISIRDLARTIASLVGYEGRLDWDTSKPDGMPRKMMDVSRLNALGWHASISLEAGLRTVIADYRQRFPVMEVVRS